MDLDFDFASERLLSSYRICLRTIVWQHTL